MLIVFVSNFLNHHQLPLCNEINRTAELFYFVATERINQERISLGYHDYNNELPYVLRSYDNEENYIIAKELIEDADIVIWGSAPFDLVQDRIRNNKLTYRYSERIFRKGLYTLLKRSNRKIFYDLYTQYASNHYYLLCTGGFTAKDYKIIRAFPGKKLKWGYFPPFDDSSYSDIIKQKRKNEIIWCGRFISLKHPESMIYLAKYLKSRQIDFHITMVGDGPLFETIKKKIINNQMQKYIELTGAVDASNVRDYMRNASIIVFTSDKREGWGAVLNEGMNSACVPVVSSDIGSAVYLIEHGNNGFLFKSLNWRQMGSYVSKLINNPSLVSIMAKRSYETIADTWNARIAVDNLMNFSTAILTGAEVPSPMGPCEKEI